MTETVGVDTDHHIHPKLILLNHLPKSKKILSYEVTFFAKFCSHFPKLGKYLTN